MKGRRLSQYFFWALDGALETLMWRRTAARIELVDRVRAPLRVLGLAALVAATASAAYLAAWVGRGVQVVDLADGSRMELTQKDRVEVAVVTPERVELHVQTGHATFRVAKNPERSFVTRAAGHTITVFGTVYSVELTVDALEVKVDEGVVEIVRDDGTGHWRVRAGERWSGTRRDAPIGGVSGDWNPGARAAFALPRTKRLL